MLRTPAEKFRIIKTRGIFHGKRCKRSNRGSWEDLPVCLVTSERADNNIGCVLTFSGQGGSFLVSAIGAFHAEDSRLSGNSIDEWLQKLFRKHLPQFKKSGTVVGRISLVRLHLGNAKKALISGLAPRYSYHRHQRQRQRYE